MTMIIVFAVLGLSAVILHYYIEKGSVASYHPLHKADAFQVRVACIGDSITYGFGIEDWSSCNYPEVLQKLLGKGYCVNNFGYSSRTISTRGDFPYINEGLYRKSIEFDPDIVIIMLGTNDSKPYNVEDSEQLKTVLNNLIKPYLEHDIYLISPLPALEERFEISDVRIRETIIPAIRGTAESYSLNYIDLYSVFLDRRDLFVDGIHPNNKGAELIAQIVYETIQNREV